MNYSSHAFAWNVQVICHFALETKDKTLTVLLLVLIQCGMFYAGEIMLTLKTFLVTINVEHVISLNKHQLFLDIVAIVYLISDVMLADLWEWIHVSSAWIPPSAVHCPRIFNYLFTGLKFPCRCTTAAGQLCLLTNI